MKGVQKQTTYTGSNVPLDPVQCKGSINSVLFSVRKRQCAQRLHKTIIYNNNLWAEQAINIRQLFHISIYVASTSIMVCIRRVIAWMSMIMAIIY